jgi:hypothetical protein
MKSSLFTILAILTAVSASFGQTEEAYETDGEPKGLLDPSRFTINHAVSFGMVSSGKSDIKSQSLYSTMLEYRFTQPVTINLNFGLPIHNTAIPGRNLTSDNIQSMDYFRNMPFNASLNWKPSENFMMRFSVTHDSYSDEYLMEKYRHYHRPIFPAW